MDNLGNPLPFFASQKPADIEKEWRNRLRSAIHPMIFAAVYSIASALSQLLQLSPVYRADVLIAAPKVLQAVFAALGDYFTWRLAGKVYGAASNEAWAAVRSIQDRTSFELPASISRG